MVEFLMITPEIITITVLDILFFVFGTIGFFIALKIILYYDAAATTQRQYTLEKQSYLSATIIKFLLFFKTITFFFFVYTLNKLSLFLPGAMCAAGVVNAVKSGTALLLLKILNLYIFAFWIVLHNEDMEYEKQPYLKLKFILYSVAYLLLVSEIVMELDYFFAIDPSSVVDCCGAIFSTTDGSYMAALLSLDFSYQLGAFYLLYGAIVLFYLLQNRYLFAVVNLLFVIVALITLISLFGTYIYKLPTHHCPFCLLQADYHYIGYFLYLFLFLGTFNGISVGLLEFTKEKEQQKFRYSLLFTTLYTLCVSYFPLAYYLRNGMWL
jgi:hypothetical protein